MNDERWTHLDLCSGIGGFALAARANGFRTTCFAEIDPFCRWYLAQNWPGVPNAGDVRAARGQKAGLVTAGFPCQPFSRAGERGGSADARAIWPALVPVIRESGAHSLLLENVPGIIEMELDRVIDDLERLRYTVRPVCIPAAAVGAPHIRERVWIMARHESRWRKVCAGGVAPALQRESVSHTDRSRLQCAGEMGELVCPAGQALSAVGLSSRAAAGGAVPHYQPALQPWPDEPEIPRMADGLPSAVLHAGKALGNAIVPQVATQLIHCLLS